MTSHSNHEQPKENITVLVIMVLMFILIAPVVGLIGKTFNSNKEHSHTEHHQNDSEKEHKTEGHHNAH